MCVARRPGRRGSHHHRLPHAVVADSRRQAQTQRGGSSSSSSSGVSKRAGGSSSTSKRAGSSSGTSTSGGTSTSTSTSTDGSKGLPHGVSAATFHGQRSGPDSPLRRHCQGQSSAIRRTAGGWNTRYYGHGTPVLPTVDDVHHERRPRRVRPLGRVRRGVVAPRDPERQRTFSGLCQVRGTAVAAPLCRPCRARHCRSLMSPPACFVLCILIVL